MVASRRNSRQRVATRSASTRSAGRSTFMEFDSARQTLSSQGPSTGTTSSSQSEGGPSDGKRARKDRARNWTPTEVLLMIQARRDLHLDELESTDPRDLMLTDSQKWASVAHDIMMAGYSESYRDPASCKAKWHQLLPNYKKIADHCARTGMNVADYWNMSIEQRLDRSLPHQFSQEFFYAMHEWLGSRPQIQPPHIRDLLSPMDGNFEGASGEGDDNEADAEGEEQTVPAMPILPETPVDKATDGSGSPIARVPQTPACSPHVPTAPPTNGIAKSARKYRDIPVGVVPIALSDSGETSGARRRRPGNTVVRRKNVAGHIVIAEASKATGAAMALQMQTIADANLHVEQQKMDLQRDLFGQQLAYQRQRDHKVHQASEVANDNTRLSITKQVEMVTCFSQLTQVLSLGLAASTNQRRPTPTEGGAPHCTPRDACMQSPGGIASQRTSVKGPAIGQKGASASNSESQG